MSTVDRSQVSKVGIFFFVALTALFFISERAQASQDTRDSNSPYGVLEFLAWDHDWNAHHYDTRGKIEHAVRLMKEAGVGFVRMDFLWSDIEPERGRFDFEKYDRIVDSLKKQNIRVLGMLEYNPGWSGKPWNAPPDPEAYCSYARAVVSHFKDRVKYWEIWNEPDCPVYWVPQDDMAAYTELLKAVYPALKKEDPTCRVLIGGLSQSPSVQLKRIYKNGGKDHFDIVALHPFVDPLLPNAMELLRGIYRSVYKVMEKNGDAGKPIWFTEIGCPGLNDPDENSRGWFAGKSPDEQGQAEWVSKLYGKPLEWPGVEKIFWAFFRDTSKHFHNGGDYFGLVKEDFSKKPSYEAYRKMARGKDPASKDNS